MAFFAWILSDFSFIHFLLPFEWAVQVLAQLDRFSRNSFLAWPSATLLMLFCLCSPTWDVYVL